MNKQRRKELANIITSVECVCVPVDIEELEGIKSDIEMVLMDEEMAFENMPENLQGSYRGEMSQEAQDNMNEAIDLIDEFISDYEDRYINVEEFPEDLKPEVEDMFQDLISEVVEYLKAATT